jgi:uncharacterized membrane protein YvlD (DUF360 family)
MAVRVNPVETPFKRSNETIFCDRHQPTFPPVEEFREHHVYTSSPPFLAHCDQRGSSLVATHFVPGIAYHGSWISLFVVALVFGVLNASVRPVLKLLTFPLLILTLGLFTFVINAFMLLITAWISEQLSLGFQVADSGPRSGADWSSASSALCCRSSSRLSITKWIERDVRLACERHGRSPLVASSRPTI